MTKTQTSPQSLPEHDPFTVSPEELQNYFNPDPQAQPAEGSLEQPAMPLQDLSTTELAVTPDTTAPEADEADNPLMERLVRIGIAVGSLALASFGANELAQAGHLPEAVILNQAAGWFGLIRNKQTAERLLTARRRHARQHTAT